MFASGWIYIFATLNIVVLHVIDSKTRNFSEVVYFKKHKNWENSYFSRDHDTTAVAGWLMCTDLHSDTSRVEVGHWSRLLLIKMK